ncbi:hypothetical protein DT075_34505 [Bacillus licheniformis]|nr:hypothetical protein DT075_34505 [Bacillus licheniformis]
MLKKTLWMGAILASFLLFSVPVSAHVTVKPTESAAGSWETYTVKVPVCQKQKRRRRQRYPKN